ncbi:arylsulfatase A-like [Bombina bombina]|uniref:arylsulfatase A-like n=1 Tax=Bombina bombina TaxID=8345 RepID=UPI00235B19B3|nr:arylsulfatase A-like [Bombina bombina]
MEKNFSWKQLKRCDCCSLTLSIKRRTGPCQNLTCFPPDTRCVGTCDLGEAPLPVYLNEKILKQPVDFTRLVPEYQKFCKSFITTAVKQNKPFFLYYAAHHTHYPQFASARYTGRSLRGKYGDALLEFDGAVGELIQTLWDLKIQENTLVIFTSDNGPETMRKERGGSSGLLKCGKSTTYEGGLREPAIMYWEGKIKSGVTSELATTLDILPTLAALTGAHLPNITLDGYDLSKLLLRGVKVSRVKVSGSSPLFLCAQSRKIIIELRVHGL